MARRNLTLNISLTPVLKFDAETGQFVSYYEEFPNAIAVGATEDDADIRLIHLVEKMWQEQPQDLERTLLTKYIRDAHGNVAGNIRIS